MDTQQDGTLRGVHRRFFPMIECTEGDIVVIDGATQNAAPGLHFVILLEMVAFTPQTRTWRVCFLDRPAAQTLILQDMTSDAM